MSGTLSKKPSDCSHPSNTREPFVHSVHGGIWVFCCMCGHEWPRSDVTETANIAISKSIPDAATISDHALPFDAMVTMPSGSYTVTLADDDDSATGFLRVADGVVPVSGAWAEIADGFLGYRRHQQAEVPAAYASEPTTDLERDGILAMMRTPLERK